ncbi:MAG TPA: DUF2125 domain-containing protein, partial [Rhizomicrobium sp.]|nr:DUF2125 domain-containing protein [Rhizomicrobium sp.]
GTHHFAFVPGSLMASAILSGGRLMRFDLDVNGIGSRDISGARLQLHFRKAPTRDAIEIAASADDLRLAPALQTGFGAHLRHAKIAATLTPATPFIPLFEGREVWDGALEAWRRGGGAVHLDDIEIKWNGVQIHATGGLGLDDHHSPQGTLALDIEGAIKAPAAGTTDGQLVRAVVQLIKVANEAPRAFTVSIALGRVNLRVTKAPHTMAGAGSLGPLY